VPKLSKEQQASLQRLNEQLKEAKSEGNRIKIKMLTKVIKCVEAKQKNE